MFTADPPDIYPPPRALSCASFVYTPLVEQLSATKLLHGAKSRRRRAAHGGCMPRHALEEEERRCWLCDRGEAGGPLVQPSCPCRVNARGAHEHCLERWQRAYIFKASAAHRCGQCMAEYRDTLSLELLKARLQAVESAEELQAQGRYDEAEPQYRETLAAQRRTLGNRHSSTLESIRNLGALLKAKADRASAECDVLLREAKNASNNNYRS